LFGALPFLLGLFGLGFWIVDSKKIRRKEKFLFLLLLSLF